MEKKIFIWITFQFPAYHSWHAAFKEVEFLKHLHRHIFHVKMKWVVDHADRDIEFIDAKRMVEKWVEENWKEQDVQMSCEMMADRLLEQFQAYSVSVSEDNENGAEVCVE